jgi:chromosome segregation protein
MIFLKKFKAHGFKSYANQVELDFTKGMTGIVGPNGAGKSNIVDGIK